jgi:hypothetical protein
MDMTRRQLLAGTAAAAAPAQSRRPNMVVILTDRGRAVSAVWAHAT